MNSDPSRPGITQKRLKTLGFKNGAGLKQNIPFRSREMCLEPENTVNGARTQAVEPILLRLDDQIHRNKSGTRPLGIRTKATSVCVWLQNPEVIDPAIEQQCLCGHQGQHRGDLELETKGFESSIETRALNTRDPGRSNESQITGGRPFASQSTLDSSRRDNRRSSTRL